MGLLSLATCLSRCLRGDCLPLISTLFGYLAQHIGIGYLFDGIVCDDMEPVMRYSTANEDESVEMLPVPEIRCALLQINLSPFIFMCSAFLNYFLREKKNHLLTVFSFFSLP